MSVPVKDQQDWSLNIQTLVYFLNEHQFFMAVVTTNIGIFMTFRIILRKREWYR